MSQKKKKKWKEILRACLEEEEMDIEWSSGMWAMSCVDAGRE